MSTAPPPDPEAVEPPAAVDDASAPPASPDGPSVADTPGPTVTTADTDTLLSDLTAYLEAGITAAADGAQARVATSADVDAEPEVVAPEVPAATAESAAPAPEPAGSDPAATPAEVAARDDAPAAPAAAGPEADLTGEPAESPAPAAPVDYTWVPPDGSDPVTIPSATVDQALGLLSWAENLPPETRTALTAVEVGQAVAVPRADWDQFTAWRNQQTTAARDADLDSLDAAPEVIAQIKAQRDEIARLRGEAPAVQAAQVQGQIPQAPGVQAPAPQPAVSNVDANLSATADIFDTALTEYAAARGLTDVEAEQLLARAVAAEVIPTLAHSAATFNPVNGQMIAPPDWSQVARQALDFALVQDPALHQRVLAGTQPAASISPAGAPGAAPDPSATVPTVDPTAVKKARAASLASAPSAAAPPPQSAGPVSQSEMTARLTADIEQYLATSAGST